MVQVVQRAAEVLRALEAYPEGRSIGELAADIDLPRSTVHRLLKALEDEHLVTAVSSLGGFRLGPGLMRLAASANGWLSAHVHRLIVELSRELDETVDLAVRSGEVVYFVDQATAGSSPLQAVSRVGVTFPLHCTANGKALLAELPDDAVRRLVGPRLDGFTPATITDVDRLLEEVAVVRTQGVAFDRQEHHADISAVGTALRNPYGLEAALSVPVPTTRFVEREDRLVPALLAGRDRIEAALGRHVGAKY